MQYTINIFNYSIFIDIFIILSLITTIFIITNHNPMYSILNLIILFIWISFYLYYIGLTIMSLLYLLVYIGAIAILFLFILALLDIKLTELNIEPYFKDYPIIFITIISLYLINNNLYNYINIDKNIYKIYNIQWNNIMNINELSSLGYILYTEYAILLIIISIIILLSIIGIIIMNIHKYNK